jgi:hypothetical protein
MYIWVMKKLLPIALIILLFSAQSCTEDKTYFEQLKSDKAFTSRILDLNKSFDVIKKEEKGTLIKEDLHLLEFSYNIGESDTYTISYLFDEKGCYEIGIDGFFELESNAKDILTGNQTEMNTSKYGKGIDGNGLNRWKNEDKSVSIELDYQETSKWMFLATIFANE